MNEVIEGAECLFISQQGARFVERYLKGQIAIAFCQRRKSARSWWKSPQDGFILHSPNFAVRSRQHHREIQLQGDRSQRDQVLMLGETVDLVQGPDGPIPTFVRAERFDFSSICEPQPCFTFNAHIGPPAVVRGGEDGEVSVTARLLAVALCECGGEQIKPRAEGVQDSPDFSIDKRIKFDRLNKINRALSGFRVLIDNERIVAARLPFDEPIKQQMDLGFGPID